MFYQRLNEIRKKKGFTALEMAEYLNIGLRSYRNYESGDREPSLALLVAIADKLDVSTDELLCCDMNLTRSFKFGKRLREQRMKHKLTQQQMADMLCTGLRNYQKYESGDARPTFEGLIAIADFLHVPTDYLLGRDDYLRSLGISVIDNVLSNKS